MNQEGYVSIAVKVSTKKRLNKIRKILKKENKRDSYNEAVGFLLNFYEGD